MADEVVQHYLYSTSAQDDSYIKNGNTTNPIYVTPYQGSESVEHTVTAGDYVVNWWYNNDDPIVPSFNTNPLYVYTLNGDWQYVGGAMGWGWGGYDCCNFIHNCAGDSELTLANGDDFEGSTCDEVIIKPKDGNTIYRSHIKNTDFYEYAVYEREEDEYYEASEVFTTTSATIKVTPGDTISALIPNNPGSDLEYGVYQYPGIWVRGSNYPDLTINPELKYKGHVQLKWTDPPDITDWKPTPATWEGTVIVRKENSAPLHRWDGDKVVRTTTRDKYKSKPYKDEDIETNKVYYYAFMPYYTKIDDPQHPIRYYTFTKCIRVETGTISYIPEIIKIDMNEDVATITYAITLPATGPYDTAKLYGKKDGNPACDNTDDIIEDISQVDDQVVVSDIDGDYFFCIQVANGTDTFTSDVVSCYGENTSVVPEEYWDIIDDITHFYYDKPTEIYDYQYTNIGDSGQSYWNHPKSNSYYNNNAQDATQAQWFNQNNFVTAFSELDINITYSSATNRYLLGFTSGAYNDAIYYFGGAQKFYSSVYLGIDGDKVAFLGRYNYNVSLPTSQTFTTLASALGYLRTHFRRCGVYVEGVQWGVRDTGHL